MNSTAISHTVAEAIEQIKASLNNKGFILFSDINHQANAKKVGLDMEESRVLLFGKPEVGTKLLQTDIFCSLDLPMRLAVVSKNGSSYMVHQTSDDFSANYQLKDHPVLEKMDALYATLIKELIGD